MDTNEKKITAKDQKGNVKEYEIIYKFDSDQTKKSYIIYTDNTYKDGQLMVYANVYDKTGKSKNLMPIETEEEWNTIETFLSKLEDLANENN